VCGLLTILGATAGGIFLAQRALAPAHLAFQRQQEFIADAAHELRTPLTLLRANAEVLLRGRERLDPDDALLLEDIVTESAHMGALANNLLLLARLDAGQESIKRDVVDISEIAEGIVRRAGAFAEENQVALRLEQPGTAPALVLGDEMLLSEAALILVDNAIKYNKTRGSVSVTVESDAHQVRLRVQDTGVGISQEHLAHLGERFYRPDKARSRELGGAGLGLSIARSIVGAHGGALSLSSTPDQGTTAILTFPKAQAVELTDTGEP
jgi:signal transduction histidine kinase